MDLAWKMLDTVGKNSKKLKLHLQNHAHASSSAIVAYSYPVVFMFFPGCDYPKSTDISGDCRLSADGIWPSPHCLLGPDLGSAAGWEALPLGHVAGERPECFWGSNPVSLYHLMGESNGINIPLAILAIGG